MEDIRIYKRNVFLRSFKFVDNPFDARQIKMYTEGELFDARQILGEKR